MLVFAHRGNSDGVNRVTENTAGAIRSCLERGWGVETDIRRANNGFFYVSHDPSEHNAENDARFLCELLRQYPGSNVALNIKELGYEADLLAYLDRERVLKQLFLFDMEMLESRPGQTAALFRRLNRDVRLAARVSDRQETISQALKIRIADVIWLDEFDRLWATEGDIHQLKAAGKTVVAISPEIHGFSLDEMRDRWRQFLDWGVDGICTDYAAQCASFIQSHSRGMR